MAENTPEDDTRLEGIRPPDEGFRLLDRRVVYDGSFVRVVRDRLRFPNGHEAEHELLRYAGAVSIIPLLEQEGQEPRLLVLEQLRSSVGGYIHEIPAGMLEPGEDPLLCARRELEEETGYRADSWRHIVTLLPTPGIAPETMTYYLARGLRPSGRQQLDPAECLHVKTLPLNGLIRSMVHGEDVEGIPPIVDAKMYTAVFFLGAYLGGGGAR